MKFLFFFLFPLFVFSQDVQLSEGFSSGLPSTWQVDSNHKKRKWEVSQYKGSAYMKMSAYAGKGRSNLKVKSWLQSPNFNALAQCKLKFAFADAFSNGQPLRVFVEDQQGKEVFVLPEKTYAELVNNTGFYDNEYEETMWIPLPSTKDPVHLVFVYDSQKGKVSTTIQLKEVKVWCR